MATSPPSLLTAFMSYVLRSNDFQSSFAAFFNCHTPTFDGYIHGTSTHSLEFTEIYSQFSELFEEKVGGFLDEEQATVRDLYDALADWRSAAGGVAAYEVDDVQEFVEAVLAVTDYNEFAIMMGARAEARRLRMAAQLHVRSDTDATEYREAEALNPHYGDEPSAKDDDGDVSASKLDDDDGGGSGASSKESSK